MTSEDRYVFLADWYDQQSSLMRKFYISYFPSDQTLEIVSTQNFQIVLVWFEKQKTFSQAYEVPCDSRGGSICGSHSHRILTLI